MVSLDGPFSIRAVRDGPSDSSISTLSPPTRTAPFRAAALQICRCPVSFVAPPSFLKSGENYFNSEAKLQAAKVGGKLIRPNAERLVHKEMEAPLKVISIRILISIRYACEHPQIPRAGHQEWKHVSC